MNHPTVDSLQYLKNNSADQSVSPTIPREGIMGKSDSGAWYNIKVDTSGRFISQDSLAAFKTCYVDEAAPITYVSMEDSDANWCVMKVDETSGTVLTYATEANNPTYTDVATARTNRATLTYQLPNLAF